MIAEMHIHLCLKLSTKQGQEPQLWLDERQLCPAQLTLAGGNANSRFSIQFPILAIHL